MGQHYRILAGGYGLRVAAAHRPVGGLAAQGRGVDRIQPPAAALGPARRGVAAGGHDQPGESSGVVGADAPAADHRHFLRSGAAGAGGVQPGGGADAADLRHHPRPLRRGAGGGRFIPACRARRRLRLRQPGESRILGHQQRIAPRRFHRAPDPIVRQIVGGGPAHPLPRHGPEVQRNVAVGDILMYRVAGEPGQRQVLPAKV